MSGLMDLIWPGAFIVQSIHVVARVGVADLLGPKPQSAEELADAVDAHAELLRRVLRALTTLGIFSEDDAGRFRHTDLSRTLRADSAGSVRAWALMFGAHFVWRPLGDLYESSLIGVVEVKLFLLLLAWCRARRSLASLRGRRMAAA